MSDWILNAGLGWIMAYPPVTAAIGIFLVWAAALLTVSKTGMGIALVLRPFVKWTKTKKDDKYLEIVIYWLDATEDTLDPLVLGRWRQSWAVVLRVREDMGKPYKKRRRE